MKTVQHYAEDPITKQAALRASRCGRAIDEMEVEDESEGDDVSSLIRLNGIDWNDNLIYGLD